MFTKEQLAKWESEGFVFDDQVKSFAVENPKVIENKKAIELGKIIEEDRAFFDSFKTTINEDAEDRYIRKVLHMIRSFKSKRRSLNILMNTTIYKAKNIQINNYVIERMVMEAKPKDQTYISLDEIKSSSLKIEIDGKLYFTFSNEEDKSVVLDYISNNKGEDNFVPAFSKFDIKKINTEILRRLNNPQRLAQKSTSLCGIAAIGFLTIKYQFLDYKYLIQDLYYYAEAFYGRQKFMVKPRNFINGQVYDIGPNNSSYPKMDQCDYIFLSSIKSSENKIRTYDGKNDPIILGIDIDGIGAFTLPGEMTTLLDKMLRCPEIKDFTRYTSRGENEIQDLYMMNFDYENGYECLMFIDSVMLDEEIPGATPPYYLSPNHWVVYCGEFRNNEDGEIYDITQKNRGYKFKVATWGRENFLTVEVSKERFEKTFYGYIKCKVNYGKTSNRYEK